ncbi:MAG: formylglycine-generating enzyme family protein [Candidatus Latescibacteria bacterium]|nr:formylglycine-generating enzyme family protein [Candidatus Latescibacterota bacterium]
MSKMSIYYFIFLLSTLLIISVLEPQAKNIKVESRIIKLDNENSLTLVSIPAGSYMMGSEAEKDEQPIHKVTLDAFEMGETEITQGQYEAITGSNPSHFSGDKNLPVEKVTWQDAALFCNKLSNREGLQQCYNEETWKCDFTKNGFRLPTEAEWEYACRAGTITEYNTGDSEQDLARAGWYGGTSGNSGEKTHPVAQKEPNIWGLFDMHGNVWEWCNDSFGGYTSEPVHNPKGPESGSYSVMRGGSWFNNAHFARSAFRLNDRSDRTGYFTGFRIVHSITKK